MVEASFSAVLLLLLGLEIQIEDYSQAIEFSISFCIWSECILWKAYGRA